MLWTKLGMGLLGMAGKGLAGSGLLQTLSQGLGSGKGAAPAKAWDAAEAAPCTAAA